MRGVLEIFIRGLASLTGSERRGARDRQRRLTLLLLVVLVLIAAMCGEF